MISQRYGDIPLVDDNRQSRSVQLLPLVPDGALEYAGPDEVVVLVQAAAQQPGQKRRLGPTG